uniref:NADH-ubiquinone oxidoreductase chain 5 n=1 Tax=Dolichovespula panda TaxID=2040468 RepID=A0A291C4W5_9HYME|nr:NADH dehydrogenase subunit 5 [Dolichovespula panda]ATF28546.1 NADH dehydrogenase subunit 5 [Dolichovespula panda]
MLIMNIFFFFFFSLMMFFLSLIFLNYDLVIMMEWVLLNFNSVKMEFVIYLDWISLMFLSLVLMISSMVLIYSLEYMKGDINIKRFFLLLMLFVISMLLMIFSPNLMSILLGWDGLGLISYCLVIYYQSWMSYNSGMFTVLLNRIGDIMILMMISLMFMLGTWNLMLFDFNFFLVFLMMLLGAFTKSAQFPFSVWLPLAMAAPTPVSSLVHSSTLVTAGVYLLIRFNFLMMNNDLMNMMLFISMITMLMAGLMANFEFDLKKIIAYSTLSQLGLMMMILSIKMFNLGFFHLLIHAMFKSLLFMCSGIMIHSMCNNQDIRYMGGLINYFPIVCMIFFISFFSLCGFPFFSGFYSKDLIMEIFLMSKMNFFSVVMLMVATLFTVSYSVRLMILVYMNYMNKMNYMILMNEDYLMSLSLIFLYFYSLMMGYCLINLINSLLIILNLFEKMFVLQICLLGIFMGWYFSVKNWIKLSIYMKFFFSSMWGLNIFYNKISFYPLKFSMNLYKIVDKGMIEYLFVYGYKNSFLSELIIFLKMMNNFVYNNMFYFFFLLILFSYFLI